MSVVTLNQKITLWQELTDDGFGGKTYTPPAIVDGKFALRNERFTDTEGDVSVSKAVFYTESVVGVSGWFVALGEVTDTSPSNEALPVRGISSNPSMFPNLIKGWL